MHKNCRLKESFVLDPKKSTEQIQLYYSYVRHCELTKIRPLPLAEFFRVISAAFYGHLRQELKVQNDGRQVVFLKGIRLKSEAPGGEDEEQAKDDEANKAASSPCLWRDCKTKLKSDISNEKLLSHIESVHFNTKLGEYGCAWKHCTRFQEAQISREGALAHFRLHVPELFGQAVTSSQKPSSPPIQNPGANPRPLLDPKDPNAQCGIPFTAALVLRNLARTKRNRDLFLTFERDFAFTLSVQSGNEGIAKILSHLLAELAKDQRDQSGE